MPEAQTGNPGSPAGVYPKLHQSNYLCCHICMTSLSQPIVIPLVQIRLLFSCHLETWWKLGVGSHRIISWALPVFSCHIFQGSNPKIKSVPSSEGQPSLKKQRFCLSNLVKLFFQTKFTSRSYSGSFLVAGKSIRGVATCTYGKGFSFRLISTRMHWVILLMATRNLARKPVEVRSLSNFSHYFLRFQVATTDFWTINSC